MKTLRTLFVLILISAALFVGFKMYTQDITIPFLNHDKSKTLTLKGSASPLDVVLYNQMDSPKLYNGCEVTSLAMVLHYAGYNVSKNTLAENIPTVPLTYSNGLKGDPNEGFVGDMENGPGLGVYHEPIYKLAKKYAGSDVTDLTGQNIKAVYRELEQGRPVWVITTSKFAPVDNIETWKTSNGNVDITYSVHSVAVTGYDEDYVYVNDPYGHKNRKTDRKNFEKAWKQMGSQAIAIEN
ncbi:C39 family peptidase [Bacillus atrophaeus]|uniref:C39 family peptidase n=1 Tax=Bacillus atrophaeus TaxID=1452 RepID=UPI0022828A55|nr:C39 family peptidase [Bacillus atrophaeus]MCY8513257.1 C39 family peptidase [Bacillus atrophaeus]MCY8992157.1 C39 family peptidase [Bacillus atrophaeus]